eukprot:gnl/TRDRNA2_/TRDRNA2_77449_c0_seq2.p2 gnl/TRDRNA2_/TRDRNA2_77449_c0~~gnl/TRDRNA2_/TRDRNA2_77449_c0_seq2.p2  ORF type:complete len:108 (-),score=24.27 gnl/TRDRNA2_/TRDRNA2_77449_c0_seq2:27-350(-)
MYKVSCLLILVATSGTAAPCKGEGCTETDEVSLLQAQLIAESYERATDGSSEAAPILDETSLLQQFSDVMLFSKLDQPETGIIHALGESISNALSGSKQQEKAIATA